MFFTKSCNVGVLLLAVGAACAGPVGSAGGKSPDAEAAYDKANKDLKEGMYPEALAEFADVKTKFPYSKYAALADLRVADTHYARDKFIEAVDAYRQFIKMHPTHDEIPYAMWRIGECYQAQAPEEWWFMPPAAEKDQADVRRAVAAYQDVIDHYPKSQYVAKAQERILSARHLLADHEWYVARFYFDHDKWQAAAGRAEGLARDYTGLGFDAEALLLAAMARLKANEPALARTSAQTVVDKFPQSTEAPRAERLLRDLPPAPAPAPATPTPPPTTSPAAGG